MPKTKLRVRPLTELRPEIVALIDLSITATRGHTVAASALWQAFAVAGERDDGATDQKIILLKICAEEVAALEDLGALAWAIANRQHGIIKAYLEYKPKQVKGFYQSVASGVSIDDLLRLPVLDGLPISARERSRFRRGLRSLQQSLGAAAHDYLALSEGIIHIYNRVKHGFAIVQRVDLITPEATRHADWEQQAHVLVGVRRDGLIKYSSIERTEAMLESLLRVIDMCGAAWKELAALVIRFDELGISLDVGLEGDSP
jgi:hypothetical protein